MVVIERAIEVNLEQGSTCKVVPELLYKYTKSIYVSDLLRNGRLRIGTLSDFRRNDIHGDYIGDTGEGRQILTKNTISNPLAFHSKAQNRFINDFFDFSRSDVDVKIEGIVFQKILTSPDYYIFSFSESRNDELYVEFDCDCRIVIQNSFGLIERITQRIAGRADYLGLYKCKYAPESHDSDSVQDYHPAITKGSTYGSQAEYRAIWRPKEKDIEPILIEVGAISEFILEIDQS